VTDPSDIPDLLGRVSREVGSFLGAADRTRYESTLFNLRKRTLFGMYCFHDHEDWYLKQIAKRASPAELGASLRRLCAPVYGPLIHALPFAYLVARENDIALGRWSTGGEKDDELARVLEFWAETAAAYRGDGHLLPSEGGATQPVLPEADATTLLDLLSSDVHEIDEVQLIAARLEMMNFVISGETRGRNFYHGPYPAAEPDAVVVVQEFTELQKRQQPWIEGLLEFPIANVAVIREIVDVVPSFDIFGFMVLDDGGGYREHIRRSIAVTVPEDGARPLTDDEVAGLSGHVTGAIQGAYSRFANWDDEYRVRYGVYHYLNEAAPFAEAVGAPELIPELRGRLEESGSRRIGDIMAMDDVPPVWAGWSGGGGAFTVDA
jgi:hypothetical protein